jgi:hypothetical protein
MGTGNVGSVILNPLNTELNPICHLLALLGHHIFHVSGLRVNVGSRWRLVVNATPLPLDHKERERLLIVHSNAHKVIAGFFLSPDPEVT